MFISKNILLLSICLFTIFMLFIFMLRLSYIKYDFNDKVIEGKLMIDILEEYKHNTPTIIEETIKILYFSFFILREMNSNTAKKIILSDTNVTEEMIEKVNELFRKYENDSLNKNETEFIKKYFMTFEINEKNLKITDEEILFIKENSVSITDLEKFTYQFFTESCANSVNEKRFVCSDILISSIDLLLARYCQFVNIY